MTSDHEANATVRNVPSTALASDLELARDRARALVLVLASDGDLASDLAHTRNLASDLAHTHAHTRDLALDNARDLAQQMETRLSGRGLEQAGALETEGSSAQRPSRMSGRLVDKAVLVLPAAHRPRYGEELRAELAEIAETGSHRRQLAYALRVACRAVLLRRELRGMPPELPARGRSW
ncbi:MAG: hypothetical protein ACRDQ5_00645 [Sciscionella sp.]